MHAASKGGVVGSTKTSVYSNIEQVVGHFRRLGLTTTLAAFKVSCAGRMGVVWLRP